MRLERFNTRAIQARLRFSSIPPTVTGAHFNVLDLKWNESACPRGWPTRQRPSSSCRQEPCRSSPRRSGAARRIPLEHDDRAGAVSAAAGDSGSAGAAAETGPRIRIAPAPDASRRAPAQPECRHTSSTDNIGTCSSGGRRAAGCQARLPRDAEFDHAAQRRIAPRYLAGGQRRA